ncbi:putative extracellular serine-rich protein [Phaeoacremonium minimum UCRPA7]|uniref:Putative extracellular serine-rich protein n=1 Tax=Phaeoacremonium minimum (strain UCR-PA7) TaxID=1286976 RepID=R8BCE0_PHAM7|nr:putative extracellular serine-rich protein [Phaeoacremonium minimum UCRPA7]EON96969.1 putative extracellular serine-rich protein [Phaeoacremonium minimum UCRPA7]
MHFASVALAALVSMVAAQSTDVIVVRVSNSSNALVFQPDNIKATVGQMVQFQFEAGNHTVTQSAFDSPCQPVSLHSNATGFHSGFQPVAASAAEGMIPTYTIMVNNTTPMWVYCAQGKHCQAGMVMVINENTAANSTRSLANFKELAKTDTIIVPGSAAAGTTGSTSTTGTSTGGTTGATGTSAGVVLKTSGSLSLLGLAAALFLL